MKRLFFETEHARSALENPLFKKVVESFLALQKTAE
jgi:hypothetical protein